MKSQSGNILGQSGAVMLEFALALPILALFVWGMVEFGRAYAQYPNNARVIYELTRRASRQPGLVPQTLQYSGSPSHDAVQNWAEQELMQNFMGLSQTHAYVNTSPSAWQFQTGYSASDDRLTVQLNSQLVDMYAVVPGTINMKGIAVGPYLYQNASSVAPTFTTIGSWDCSGSPGASSATPCNY